MTIVLMDNRRHKTLDLFTLSARVVVPVEVREDGRWNLAFDRAESIHLADWSFGFREAVFTFMGDHLCGDPIFLQTKGPELPESWWH